MLAALETVASDGNLLLIGVAANGMASDVDTKAPPALSKRWGVAFKTITPKDKTKKPHAELETDATWHLGPAGVFEKPMGSGIISLVPEAQRLNNETLAGNADSRSLIPAFLEDKRSVVFEETHLGLEESGSIAGLARRYRLQGLLAGLLIVAALFVWNRSVSFPPPNSYEHETESFVAGADARTMFVGLLGRHLSPGSLINACVAEWNRVKPDRRIIEYHVAKNSPVEAYRRIQQDLTEKKTAKP
jgi:hypothetical protein